MPIPRWNWEEECSIDNQIIMLRCSIFKPGNGFFFCPIKTRCAASASCVRCLSSPPYAPDSKRKGGQRHDEGPQGRFGQDYRTGTGRVLSRLDTRGGQEA
ncbi:hypothetical protein GOC53_07785 [Sinorhizobium medicae]|nr:hypothetical protein [Sinorhizobium medicae]MDX0490158.1 hypothetical protein [Sinorhizobium medicae]MDX0853371.1 hypothetical protein [Sinorhizobium medicae]MDX0871539.1 hypothetical protein [Sinorhizobium medicae]MDX0951641.1 hypothetical protein [Sinorhizobium medicae]